MPAKTARSTRAAAEVGGSSRERILAEAERVFGARGFDGASMRQLADAADVPAALVSYHFGSKEGLIAPFSSAGFQLSSNNASLASQSR